MSEIEAMTGRLQSVVAQLEAGAIPRTGVEELKSSIDDLRLRVWAVMSAHAQEDAGVLERFRLRRAISTCQDATNWVRGNLVGLDHPEIQELRAKALGLAETITARTRG